MDAIDILLLLLAPLHPSLLVIAIVLFGARRSAFVCRGFATFGAVRALPEALRLVLLPGLVVEEATKDEGRRTKDETESSFIVAPVGLLTTEQWRDALDLSPHLLIYGPTGAGKSTLAQAIVAMIGDCDYLVIDPMPNRPGEHKWGGIDFVTLDDGDDEYASIRAALAAVDAEDQRRRHMLRTATPRTLVVIIDEVLALVSELGVATNEDGRKEPRMSQFIRTKGYSARHRRIKIILVSQGKNLDDLGLKSATGRNNYAMVRLSRNAATNERGAAIVTEDGEQPIDLQYVPRLAAEARSRARVWRPGAGQTLERLLAPAVVSWGDMPGSVHTGMDPEKSAPGAIHTGMPYQYAGGMPDIDAPSGGMLTIPPDRDERIKLLVNLGVSANAIADTVRGDRNAVLARVRELRRN
jgi:ATPase family protein associated with various cellular activities (AAA)